MKEINFNTKIGTFIHNHKALCTLTLGLAIVGYAIGVFARWSWTQLTEPVGTTKKVDTTRSQILNDQTPPTTPILPKSLAGRVSPGLPSFTPSLEQINLTNNITAQSMAQILGDPFIKNSDFEGSNQDTLFKALVDFLEQYKAVEETDNTALIQAKTSLEQAQDILNNQYTFT